MTQPLTDDLRHFLDANTVGVIATTAADGRPRQSLDYVRDDDRLLISTLTDRLKARDVRRSGGIGVRHGARGAVSVRGAVWPGRNPRRENGGPEVLRYEEVPEPRLPRWTASWLTPRRSASKEEISSPARASRRPRFHTSSGT